jgi:hypothetical protein
MREKKRETQTHYNDVIMGNDEKIVMFLCIVQATS